MLNEGFKKGSGGTYIFNEGKIVKISEDSTKSHLTDAAGNIVPFPKSYRNGYYDMHLRKYFNSKREYATFLKVHNIAINSKSDSVHIKDCCNVINEERVKRGEKPKSERELVGNSRDYFRKNYGRI